MMNSEKITMAKTATLAIIGGQGSVKINRKVLEGLFAELHDREAAAQAACRILDELKADGRVGVKVTETAVTKIVNGISYDSTEKTRNDTTSNAKRLLAAAVNAAYSGYPDKLIIVTDKTAPSIPSWKTAEETDKISSALDRLLTLLDCTEAEGESIRHAVATLKAARATAAMDAIHGEALALHEEWLANQADVAKRMAEVTVTARQLAEEKGYKGKQADAFVSAYLMVANG